MTHSWYYRLLHRIGYEAYWWWSEIKTAFLSGMEDAGWKPRGLR